MNEALTPVIIGTAQLVDRDASLERHLEPLDMLTRMAHEAARDAGRPDLLQQLDTVALVSTAGWTPANAPNLLARALGAHPATELVTADGGQVGITLINRVAGQIAAGKGALAFVGGCNNLRVLSQAARAGQAPSWPSGGEGSPTLVAASGPGNSDLEASYGLRQPPDIYPLFENALRSRLGLDLEAHRQRMGRLFSRFTEVAAENPYAWFPTRRSAEELTTVTPDNRMIAFPYPKYLNAVLNTEQAAGLVICSAERARQLGVPEERWVYWLGGAHSEERAWWASERPDFAACPAMRDTHLSALANAGLSLAEMDYFDLYSCFPVAVEMACEMLGLSVDDPRGFTVTGGLPYAGGPASAYTLHSAASMVDKLRDQPGKAGLVTGNGWYLTKHSAAVLASRPPADHTPREALLESLPSRDMDATPRPVVSGLEGAATVQAYTVTYNREGAPTRGIVLGMSERGERFLANTPQDRDLLEAFVAEEQVGASGQLRQSDGMQQFLPAGE